MATVFCNALLTTGTHLENLISINNCSILTALIHKNITLQIVIKIHFCMELINKSISEMFLLSKYFTIYMLFEHKTSEYILRPF